MKKLLFLLVCWVGLCGESWGQGWFELGTGDRALKANQPILTLCSDSCGNIYAAGSFNDTHTGFGKYYVARWDAMLHYWSQVGIGSNALNANDMISSICIDKYGNVYAAGSFTEDSTSSSGYMYVAKWDGTIWSELGTGINALKAHGPINSICVDDSGNVYAAGNFRNSYGESYVAKWNGAHWNELAGLHANLFINSICVDHSLNIYAAGTFSDTGGHKYVAKWANSLSAWTELGSGFDSVGTIIDIAAVIVDSMNNVFAAVNFGHVYTSITRSNVFAWDGTSWSMAGGVANALNANNNIFTLEGGDNNFIYAAGQFTNSVNRQYVAKYDKASKLWSELGMTSNSLDANSVVIALCTDKYNNVFAAGDFSDSVSNVDNFKYVAEFGISTLTSNDLNSVELEIEAYPNPTNSILRIRGSVAFGSLPMTYCLTDCSDRVCKFGELNNTAIGNSIINIEDLPNGIYFLKIGGRKKKICKY